jgi:putative ABC transport system permease protein
VSRGFKVQSRHQKGDGRLRKALVVFQFATSLILLAGTFLVYRQINFMHAQDKGLNMDQMLIVEGPRTVQWGKAKQLLQILKREAASIPGIGGVATSGAVPGRGFNWGADVRRVGADLSAFKLGSVAFVDPDFSLVCHAALA